MDEAHAHETFCGASNAAANARRYGDGTDYGAHLNARDCFLLAVSIYRFGRKDVYSCINWFKGVTIGVDGGTRQEVELFTLGRSLVLRADMDLIVILINYPHLLDNRPDFSVTPLRATGWRSPVTVENDPRQSEMTR